MDSDLKLVAQHKTGPGVINRWQLMIGNSIDQSTAIGDHDELTAIDWYWVINDESIITTLNPLIAWYRLPLIIIEYHLLSSKSMTVDINQWQLNVIDLKKAKQVSSTEWTCVKNSKYITELLTWWLVSVCQNRAYSIWRNFDFKAKKV